MFQTKVVEKIKTHILRSTTFFRKSCRLWDNVEKYCTAGQATDDNSAHALFIQYTDYKHTFRICNTFCFSTAATVARTPLHATLCVRVNCVERINLQNNFINMYFLWPNFHYLLSWLGTVTMILFSVSNTWNWTQGRFRKNEISSIRTSVTNSQGTRGKSEQNNPLRTKVTKQRAWIRVGNEQ